MHSKNIVDIVIKNKMIKRYHNKTPLLIKEALLEPKKTIEEGQILNIYSENKQFIGKGYYGKQNKGCGWIVAKEKDAIIDATFFERLIKKAIDRRKSYYEDESTTAFRIFNGEGDGFGGFTIDYFASYYMITWYNLGIYSFKEEVLEGLKRNVEYKGIYEKKRFDKQGKYVEANDFVMGQEAPEPLLVLENNVRFAIYLNDGPMVGVFLDQREVRKTIRDTYAKGKKVLNTFSYTGAFSVFAAAGGATKTTSVDLANRSKPKTREQFEINYIDPDTQEIIVEDVFHYFKYAGRKGLRFDMVILDPPSFARSKKRTFSVAKDYVELLKDAIQITEDHGIIVASTNCSNFDMKKFKKFIDVACKESNVDYKIRETFSLPKDFHVADEFPEGDYLKVVFIEKFKK